MDLTDQNAGEKSTELKDKRPKMKHREGKSWKTNTASVTCGTMSSRGGERKK